MELYFMLWVIIQYYFILLCKNVSALATGNSFHWFCALLHTTISVGFFGRDRLSTSLFSGTTIVSSLILYIFCPNQ